MKQVVYIVHGMRKGEHNNRLMHFVENMSVAMPYTYRIAFLESETLRPDKVMTSMISSGATTIIVVPLLLFSATHYCEDVPYYIDLMQRLYPDITFLCTAPLGTHPHIVNWVTRRVQQYEQQELTTRNTAIVLLTHGSPHTRLPDIELQTLVQQCTYKCTHYTYYAASYYGAYDFECVVQQLSEHYEQLYVIPLFLCDGFIVRKVAQRIMNMCLPQRVHIGHALNFGTHVSDIVAARIAEAEEVKHVSNTVEHVR